MRSVETVLALVVLAVVVATFAGRLRIPAPSLLVLAGVAVGLVPGVPVVALDPAAVSLVVLPPLLYAASTDLALGELRAVLRPVVVLAVGLVAASAVAVAVTVHLVSPQVPLAAGFVLGAALASTDPVAVSALARELDLPPRLLALVQGESLLNDASSLVLFQVSVAVAAAGTGVQLLPAAGQFVRLAGGGVLVGLVLAVLAGQVRRRSQDPVLETAVAVLTPYAVYVAAQTVSASGVTAVVVAGLYLGDRGLRLSSGRSRLQIATVYSVLVFLLESVVFAVIGLELPALVRRLPAGEDAFLPSALAVFAVLVLTRVLWVYPVAYLPGRLRGLFRRRGTGGLPLAAGGTRFELPWQVPAVVSWAGTRGVVPLAAALSIPLVTRSGAAFPHRDLLLVLATGCIVATLVVQGLTLGPLVRRLGVAQDSRTGHQQEALARHAAVTAALVRLEELTDVDAVPRIVAERLQRELSARLERTRQHLDAVEQHSGDATGAASHPDGDFVDSSSMAYRHVRQDLLATETARLLELRDEGQISEAVRRRVQRLLDVEETGLAPE